LVFLVLAIPFAAAEEQAALNAEALIQPLAYDNAGNLIQGFSKYFIYDQFNQLAQIRENSVQGRILEQYTYDHAGNRIKKVEYDAAGQAVTAYYPSGNFVQELSPAGTKSTVYYYDDAGTLLAWKDSSGTYFSHPDHLGSTSVVTDAAGQKVSETSYQPFGAVFSGGNDRFLFTGKELDASGLYYYGARYYNPYIAHFTQADTVLQDIYDPQLLNRYSYVRNNPYKYVDPTGNYISPLDLLDYASTIDSVINMVKNPSWENAGWLAADIVSSAVPFLGGFTTAGKGIKYGSKAARAADKVGDAGRIADKASDAARIINKAGDGARAADRTKDLVKSADKLKKGEQLIEQFAKNPGFRDKVKRLKEGPSRTDVVAGSYDEAHALLASAFPDIRKVSGAGPNIKPASMGDSMLPGTYKTDFLKDPSTGRIYGEGIGGKHAYKPHINILTSKGKRINIIIDDMAK